MRPLPKTKVGVSNFTRRACKVYRDSRAGNSTHALFICGFIHRDTRDCKKTKGDKITSALTYGDYLGIALFTIGLYFMGQIVYEILAVIIRVYLNDKKDTPQLPSVFYLLESSHRFEVTMGEAV